MIKHLHSRVDGTIERRYFFFYQISFNEDSDPFSLSLSLSLPTFIYKIQNEK